MKPTSEPALAQMPMTEEPVTALPRQSLGPGRIASRYRLLGLLGAGGMGEVYEAIHVSIDRLVAVKVLRPEHVQDARARERLEREARIVGALECENVVAVLDFGQFEDGTPYLVMERLRGDDLKSVLKLASRLPVRRAVAIALDVCRGLQAAHRAGLVHRDLKPANLFLCRRSNGEELCKILDFGVARRGGATTSFGGGVVGTARYMAPEQIREDGEVTAAADLYAVGALLYECLSGVPVHDAESIEAVLFRVLYHEPQPLRELVPELPAALCAVVERTLAKDPKERYQSAAELAKALQAIDAPALLSESLDATDSTLGASFEVDSRRASSLPRPRRFSPAFLAVAGAALALAAFGAGLVSGRRPPPSAASATAPAALCAGSVNAAPSASVAPNVSTSPSASSAIVARPATIAPTVARRKLASSTVVPVLAGSADTHERAAKASPFVATNPYTSGAASPVAGP